MRVKAKQDCYFGCRRRKGEVFDLFLPPGQKPNPDTVEVLDADAPVPEEPGPYDHLTIDQVRERLQNYGVKFAPQHQRAKLIALLAEAEGKG